MAINPFVDDYLPTVFWPAQIATFGVQVSYLPPRSQQVMMNMVLPVVF